MLQLFGNLGGSADFDIIHYSIEDNTFIIRTLLTFKTHIFASLTMITSIFEKPCRLDIIKTTSVLTAIIKADMKFDMNQFLEALS